MQILVNPLKKNGYLIAQSNPVWLLMYFKPKISKNFGTYFVKSLPNLQKGGSTHVTPRPLTIRVVYEVNHSQYGYHFGRVCITDTVLKIFSVLLKSHFFRYVGITKIVELKSRVDFPSSFKGLYSLVVTHRAKIYVVSLSFPICQHIHYPLGAGREARGRKCII